MMVSCSAFNKLVKNGVACYREDKELRCVVILGISILVCLFCLTPLAIIPAVLRTKALILAQAAPTLAMLTPGTALSERDEVTGIIVLGGSVTRVREAIALARRFPDARVLLSGPGDDEIALAAFPDLLRQPVIDLRAHSTFENALFSKALIKPKPGQRWLLVTSAVHMPRAIASFCAAGFPAEPWPVQDTPTDRQEAARQVQHEILGLIGYRLLGRTRAIFVRPGERCA